VRYSQHNFALQLLIDQIEDEKRMFAGAALTRQEREQMAFNEKILKIATEIKRSHEATVEETYVMPRTYDKDSKGMTERQKLLKARYKCVIPAAQELRAPAVCWVNNPNHLPWQVIVW
jgi:hypothetical protein